MPHLDHFRRDVKTCYLRITHDAEYWDGVRAVLNHFGRSTAYNPDTREFAVPNNTRSWVRLSMIFPDEWAFIEDTNAWDVSFTPDPSPPPSPKSAEP
jgi:hypothetical protein